MARPIRRFRDLNDPLEMQALNAQFDDLCGYVALKVTEGFIKTTDATVTTLLTIPLEDNRTAHLIVNVVARRTGGAAGTAGDGASYQRIGTFYRVAAGSATLIGALSTPHTAESQGGWDCTLTASGTDVLVRVTGAVNNNLNWGCLVTLQRI